MNAKKKQDELIDKMIADEREIMYEAVMEDVDSAMQSLKSIRLSVKHALDHLDHLMALKALAHFYEDLEFVRSEVASVNSDTYCLDGKLHAVANAMEANE